MASLSETVRFQPLRAGSVTQEREHVLNGKDSDSDGFRRRDRVEPTPTRVQMALGRRSPHLYMYVYIICISLCMYACIIHTYMMHVCTQ